MLSAVLWMLLVYAQDACTSHFLFATKSLIGPDYHVFLPLALTLVEVCTCLALLRTENQHGGHASTLEPLCLTICCHAFGMFLTNIWFRLEDPEFGLPGAYLEPMLCLVLMFVCTGLSVKLPRVLGIVVIAFGLVLLSTNLTTLGSTRRTVLLQVIIGVFLILRNICVSVFHGEGVKIVPRSRTISGAVLASSFMTLLTMMCYLPSVWIAPVAVVFAVLLLHVASTYWACAWVIPKCSLLTVCVLRSLVQFAESFFLVETSCRPLLLTCVFASCVLVLGLGLYFHDVQDTGSGSISRKTVSTNEMLTRIQFLLFSTSVVGVLFYGLHPRVSRRDLHTLKYVGLDQLIRKLLSIDMPEDHEH